MIIVGAGIGGLTTAAYLSKVGIPSLLLEQTNFIGGRCSTRVVNGKRYEVGALYVGGGVFDNLRQTFGMRCPSIPIACGIKIGENIVSFPVRLRTLCELRACGVPWTEIFRFKYRSRILSNLSTFERYESVGEVFDNLTQNVVLRKFLDSTAGLSGISPYRLSGRYMYTKSPTFRHKSLNPEYLLGGNGRIASLLFNVAQKNCTLVFGARVNKILMKGERVEGVETTKGKYSGQVIVSNAGLKPTVLDLMDSKEWNGDYYNQVRQLQDTLQVVNIFLTFSRSFNLPKGLIAFLVPNDVNREFVLLENGSFPTNSMYILHVPSNIEIESDGDHWATLQFYYPRGGVEPDLLDIQVNRILRHGLEKLFNGLSRAITSYTVYDPARYEQEFGFTPYVFGVSPDLRYKRFSIHTPIDNLFCVGDSVEPDGPCVAQAMESGLACARMIAQKLEVHISVN